MLVQLLIGLCVLTLVSSEGGGIAELKSITGDAPYMGNGNQPAFIPQPQGFWGRSRFSPMGYGGGPYYGGGIGGPFGMSGYGGSGQYGYGGFGGGQADRFTSQSGSPFVGSGSRMLVGESPIRMIMDALVGEREAIRPLRPSPSSLSPITSPSSSSLSTGGGGFYKGRGNEFAAH